MSATSWITSTNVPTLVRLHVHESPINKIVVIWCMNISTKSESAKYSFDYITPKQQYSFYKYSRPFDFYDYLYVWHHKIEKRLVTSKMWVRSYSTTKHLPRQHDVDSDTNSIWCPIAMAFPKAPPCRIRTLMSNKNISSWNSIKIPILKNSRAKQNQIIDQRRVPGSRFRWLTQFH